MSKEAMGAFIDAVYAIAITILALEVPESLEGEEAVDEFLWVLREYAIAFAVLFALWVHHRRINALVEHHTRATLWLSGIAMLAACLIPRATSLVFHYGGIASAGEVLEDDSRAQLVDRFNVLTIMVADLAMLALAFFATPRGTRSAVRTHKTASTVMLALALLVMVNHPVEDRYFALALPLALLLEIELLKLLGHRKRPTPGTT